MQLCLAGTGAAPNLLPVGGRGRGVEIRLFPFPCTVANWLALAFFLLSWTPFAPADQARAWAKNMSPLAFTGNSFSPSSGFSLLQLLIMEEFWFFLLPILTDFFIFLCGCTARRLICQSCFRPSRKTRGEKGLGGRRGDVSGAGTAGGSPFYPLPLAAAVASYKKCFPPPPPIST